MRSHFGIALGLGIPFVLALGAFVACGAPSSFDNITGGPPLDAGVDSFVAPLTEDPTLPPPRAIAPLSATFFNGLRPTLRWELTSPAIGVRVSLCGDPQCAGPKKKSFAASGRELTVPEDLEPGLWFWSLTSTTATSFGTKPSQTFSLLVRGGKAGGTPVGSILDPNGDGKIDLVVTVELNEDGKTERYGVLLLGTSIDDPTAVSAEASDTLLYDSVGLDATFQTTDLDGDGFSDILLGSQRIFAGDTTPTPYIDIATGGPGPAGFDTSFRLFGPQLPPFDAIPFLRTPGDLDLDGYGDLLIGTKREVIASYGAKDGPAVVSIVSQIVPVGPDSGVLPPPTAPIAVSGSDLDADGRSGLVMASYFEGTPFFRLRGAADRRYEEVFTSLVDAGAPTPATNFASGDLDGDGKSDLVFLTTVAGKASLCLLAGSEDARSAKLACWAPATPPPGFATDMVVADLDGDGKDEVLVSATTGGVDVLSVPAPGQLTAEHLAIDYGTRLTVMHPGRPKPAVWAATRSDGASVGIFRGKEKVRVIDPLPLFGAATPTKFAPPIR